MGGWDDMGGVICDPGDESYINELNYLRNKQFNMHFLPPGAVWMYNFLQMSLSNLN